MASAVDIQLSYALCRIIELEEALGEANEIIHRLIEGDAAEWDLA